MRVQKSQPAGAATLVPHSASTGPLKKMYKTGDVKLPIKRLHQALSWLCYGSPNG